MDSWGRVSAGDTRNQGKILLDGLGILSVDIPNGIQREWEILVFTKEVIEESAMKVGIAMGVAVCLLFGGCTRDEVPQEIDEAIQALQDAYMSNDRDVVPLTFRGTALRPRIPPDRETRRQGSTTTAKRTQVPNRRDRGYGRTKATGRRRPCTRRS